MGQNQSAHLGVVLAEHAHHLFRLGRLGEGGEPAQVEEHHGDVAPVALERILGAAGDDQLGELWREEALEPAQALELGHLLLHPMLERVVQLAQLVVKRFDAEQRAHPGEQLRLIDRLGQEVVGASLDALHALLGGIERGDHHDRQHGRGRVVANLPAHLVAAHLRHHHVEQHQVGVLALDDGQRLGARRRGDRAIALGREQIGQELHVLRGVVHDEDGRGHRRPATAPSTAARNSRRLIGLVW